MGRPRQKKGNERKALKEKFAAALQELGTPYSLYKDGTFPEGTVKNWVGGHGSLPGYEQLAKLGKTLGVTADWLLGIEGAPKYRNQWRTDAALEADLAGAVGRELDHRHPPIVPGGKEPYRWVVSGAAVLRAAIEKVTADATSALAWERSNRENLKDLDALLRAAKLLVARQRRGDKESGDAAGRLLRAAYRLSKRSAFPTAWAEGTPVLLVPESIHGDDTRSIEPR